MTVFKSGQHLPLQKSWSSYREYCTFRRICRIPQNDRTERKKEYNLIIYLYFTQTSTSQGPLTAECTYLPAPTHNIYILIRHASAGRRRRRWFSVRVCVYGGSHGCTQGALVFVFVCVLCVLSSWYSLWCGQPNIFGHRAVRLADDRASSQSDKQTHTRKHTSIRTCACAFVNKVGFGVVAEGFKRANDQTYQKCINQSGRIQTYTQIRELIHTSSGVHSLLAI